MAANQGIVSVVCAEPGSQREFEELLASLRAQAGIDWELLVPNPCGGDAVARADDRVRVLSEAVSSVADVHDQALDAACGEYVTFVEPGEILGVGALERRVRLVRSGAVAEVAYCPIEYTGPCLNPLGFNRSSGAVLTFDDTYSDPLVLSSILGRRGALRSVRFDRRFGDGAAWAYVTRLLRRGVRINRADGCEVLHRLGTSQRSAQRVLDAERDRLAVLDLVYGVDEECASARPEWEAGLRQPELGIVRMRRLAGLLVELFLADDPDALAAAVELAAEHDPVPDLDLRREVRRTAACTLACPMSVVPARLLTREKRLGALADEVRLHDRLPSLAGALARGGLPLATNRPLVPMAADDRDGLPEPGEAIIGPFERDQARLREHELVHGLFEDGGRRPGRMIDVGAHIGGTLRSFCADGWTVRAFEPDPVNRAGLEQRARPHWNLRVDPRAVSDRTGEIVQFFRTPDSTGASSMTAFTDRHAVATTVETVALRDAVGGGHTGHVHLLKTDTEGHDLPALRGFPWDDDHPDVVMCEFEDNKTKHLGYTTADLAGFLAARGYEVFVSEWHPIVRYGLAHDFKSLYRWGSLPVSDQAWGNLIGVRSSSAAHRLVELARQRVGLVRTSDAAGKASEPRSAVPSLAAGAVRSRRSPQVSIPAAVRALGAVAHWYASPSGAVLALAAVLLGLAFADVGPWRLFGLLGVLVLALFLPWKFSAQYRRTDHRLRALAGDLAAYQHQNEGLADIDAAPPSSRENVAGDKRADVRTVRLAVAAAIARSGSSPQAPDPSSTQDAP